MTKALGIDLGTGGLDAAAPIYSKKKKKILSYPSRKAQ